MLCLTCVAVALIPFIGQTADESHAIRFQEPVDAISIEMQSDDPAYVRAFQKGKWTDWQSLSVENEQDPTLRESNLVLFDESVSRIEFKGDVPAPAVHPIRISNAPIGYKVASTASIGAPHILTRRDWGADDTLLYAGNKPPITTGGDVQEVLASAGAPTQRETDCKEAQTNWPDEFKTANSVTKENGKTLSWTRTYSKKIKALVIHHTAIQVTGDARSGEERMRALYQYHSANRGWGDIGYHYVIDENGHIFEGKSGGPYVVAGHAYCNNVGTVGIALLGNFEVEQPGEEQIKSLQWLLQDLASTYDIDVTKNITYHGKSMPAIVGHRDLLQTDCPGYYVYGLLDQIRSNVRAGTINVVPTLLPLRSPLPTARPASVSPSVPIEEASEDSTGQVPDRIARLQRKIRTATRLSGKVGGRASKLAEVRRTSSPVQSVKVLPGRPAIINRTSSSSSSSRSSLTPRSPSSRSPISDIRSPIRIHLESRDQNLASCDNAPLSTLAELYRGTVTCAMYNGKAVIINTVGLEDYMMGLAEEPDTEPYEKQRAFAIAARTYAAWYMLPENRKFPGAPYDGSDNPANFQKYVGKTFELKNPRWVQAVTSTAAALLKKNGNLIKPPYFSSDTGVTRTPAEAGWKNFPFIEIFTAKDDPWCKGLPLAGHGVGMSGCGAKGQAKDGKTGEEILQYYYPGTVISYEL